MRIFLLFAALLALFPALAAATPLENFMNSTFEPGQAVSSYVLLPAQSFSVITTDGKETYVLELGTGAKVSDRSALAALLEADAKNRTGFGTKVSSALALPENLKSAKKDAEAKCMQYTGTDTHECTDKQTCTVACFSVPQCSSGPLYSDGFWEAVLEWTDDRKAYGLILDAYFVGLQGVETDAAVADKKLSELAALSALAQDMSDSPIFLNRTDYQCVGKNATRCYEYCPKVDYGASTIEAGKQNLVALKGAIAEVAAQSARADAILAASSEYDAYVGSRGKDFAELENRMQNDARKLNESYRALSAKVNDTQAGAMVASVAALSAKISADGDAGKFRAALAAKPQYEKDYKAASDRIADGQKKYGELFARIAGLQGKLDKGAWLLGNQTTGDYSAQLAAINATLAGVLSLEKIGAAGTQLDALEQKIGADLAAKATEAPSGTQAPQAAAKSALPCLPAFVFLLLAGLAFARR